MLKKHHGLRSESDLKVRRVQYGHLEKLLKNRLDQYTGESMQHWVDFKVFAAEFKEPISSGKPFEEAIDELTLRYSVKPPEEVEWEE